MRGGILCVAAVMVSLASGCAGGGVHGPSAASVPSASGGATHARTAAVVLRIPPRPAAAVARRTRYVPALVQSVQFVASPSGTASPFNVVLGSATCPAAGTGYVCSFSVPFAPSDSSLVLTAYDTALVGNVVPAIAQVLARGGASLAAPADQATVTVPLVLGGVPSTVDAAVAGTLPSAGTVAGSVTATLAIRDAAGSAIVGPSGTVSTAGAALTFQLSVPSVFTDVQLSVPARSVGPAATIAVQPGDVVTVAVAGGGVRRSGVMLTLTQNDGTTTTRLGFVRVPADTSGVGSITLDSGGFGGFNGAAGVPPDAVAGSGSAGQGVVVLIGNSQIFRINFDQSGSQTASDFCTPPNLSTLGAIAVGPAKIGLAYVRNDGTSLVARINPTTINAGGGSCAQSDDISATGDLGPPYTFTDLAADGGAFYALATFSGTSAAEFMGTIGQTAGSAGYVSDSSGGNPKPGFASVAAWNGRAAWVGTNPSATSRVFRYGPGGVNKTAAGVSLPTALASDDNGNVYLLDGANIDRCNAQTAALACATWTAAPSGTISAARPMTVGADGALWIATSSPANLVRIDVGTLATRSIPLSYLPQYVVASGDGRIYVVGSGRIQAFP